MGSSKAHHPNGFRLFPEGRVFLGTGNRRRTTRGPPNPELVARVKRAIDAEDRTTPQDSGAGRRATAKMVDIDHRAVPAADALPAFQSGHALEMPRRRSNHDKIRTLLPLQARFEATSVESHVIQISAK